MTFPLMQGLDPSKLKPETLMKLTRLVQELPPSMIHQMQSLMHNAMAGFDVRSQMEEFEKNLPPGFREKLAALMYEAHGVGGMAGGLTPEVPVQAPSQPIETEAEARLTVLRAVASGGLTPEEAYQALFE